MGLHGGVACKIALRPARAGGGVNFLRADLPGSPAIAAKLEFVDSTVRGTNLEKGAAQVFTVEHVLSACAGLGVDDLDVVMDGPEPPAMDGSAKPFVDAILKAGIKAQPGSVEALELEDITPLSSTSCANTVLTLNKNKIHKTALKTLITHPKNKTSFT